MHPHSRPSRQNSIFIQNFSILLTEVIKIFSSSRCHPDDASFFFFSLLEKYKFHSINLYKEIVARRVWIRVFFSAPLCCQPASQQRRASRRMNLCPMTYFRDTQNISFNLSSDFLCFRSFLSDSDALNPNHITLCLRFVVCLPFTPTLIEFRHSDAEFNNSGAHALNFNSSAVELGPPWTSCSMLPSMASWFFISSVLNPKSFLIYDQNYFCFRNDSMAGFLFANHCLIVIHLAVKGFELVQMSFEGNLFHAPS